MSDIDPRREFELNMTRRQLFGRGALGLGTASMAGLFGADLKASGGQDATGLHHAPTAKRVIYLL